MDLSKRICGKMLVSYSLRTVMLERLTFFLFSKEYVCPKCNHFNASIRSKRSSRQQQNTSPNASATSSPSSPVTPASITRQPSLPQSQSPQQESDLPNVDRMEVDTEVDASTWRRVSFDSIPFVLIIIFSRCTSHDFIITNFFSSLQGLLLLLYKSHLLFFLHKLRGKYCVPWSMFDSLRDLAVRYVFL